MYTCDFTFQTVREAFAKTESPVVGKLLLASFVSVRAELNAHFDQTLTLTKRFVVIVVLFLFLVDVSFSVLFPLWHSEYTIFGINIFLVAVLVILTRIYQSACITVSYVPFSGTNSVCLFSSSVHVRWLNVFNTESSPERYWRGPRFLLGEGVEYS